jgi:hypothetical protein
VIANMRGSSPQDVAQKILSSNALRGLQVRFALAHQGLEP